MTMTCRRLQQLQSVDQLLIRPIHTFLITALPITYTSAPLNKTVRCCRYNTRRCRFFWFSRSPSDTINHCTTRTTTSTSLSPFASPLRMTILGTTFATSQKQRRFQSGDASAISAPTTVSSATTNIGDTSTSVSSDAVHSIIDAAQYNENDNNDENNDQGPEIEYFDYEEDIDHDHSDYNDYYPDYDKMDDLLSHIPIFNQRIHSPMMEEGNVVSRAVTPPPPPPSPKTKTKIRKSSKEKLKSHPQQQPEPLRSIQQLVQNGVVKRYEDRLAQKDVLHPQCRTCPICKCVFIGGRQNMIHHLLHNHECTKDVPTELLLKLIANKETIDGVTYDDVVLEDKGPKPKKKKKVLTKSESKKLHRKKVRKRDREYKAWIKERERNAKKV